MGAVRIPNSVLCSVQSIDGNMTGPPADSGPAAKLLLSPKLSSISHHDIVSHAAAAAADAALPAVAV